MGATVTSNFYSLYKHSDIMAAQSLHREFYKMYGREIYLLGFIFLLYKGRISPRMMDKMEAVCDSKIIVSLAFCFALHRELAVTSRLLFTRLVVFRFEFLRALYALYLIIITCGIFVFRMTSLKYHIFTSDISHEIMETST